MWGHFHDVRLYTPGLDGTVGIFTAATVTVIQRCIHGLVKMHANHDVVRRGKEVRAKVVLDHIAHVLLPEAWAKRHELGYFIIRKRLVIQKRPLEMVVQASLCACNLLKPPTYGFSQSSSSHIFTTSYHTLHNYNPTFLKLLQ